MTCPILSFFTILHPQLLSTLFPYTTLFRSLGISQSWFESSPVFRPAAGGYPWSNTSRTFPMSASSVYGLWRRDRKSTRLNSSHITISYAVFCLKKKNTTLRSIVFLHCFLQL